MKTKKMLEAEIEDLKIKLKYLEDKIDKLNKFIEDNNIRIKK